MAWGKIMKSQPEWTLEEGRLFGTKPDPVLTRKFGRPVSAVRHCCWKKRIRLRNDRRPEDDKILGTRKNREVGCSLAAA